MSYFGPRAAFADVGKKIAAFELPHFIQIAAPTSVAFLSSQADSTNATLNSRRLAVAPANSGITDITLAFPGWGILGGNGIEVAALNNVVVTAALEYPIGTTPRQIFFNNGATSLTITPGIGAVFFSDPMPDYIPPGAQFAIKCYATWSGTIYLTGYIGTVAAGEWTNKGASLTDNTLTNTSFSNSGANGGFTGIVFARPAVAQASIGVIGDSISAGAGDNFNNVTNSNGIFGRAFRGGGQLFGLGVGGTTAANYLLGGRGQHALLRDRITHLIIEFGINDVTNGVSAATMEANLQAIAAPYLARGVNVWGWTLTPHTTSSDGWISTTQTLTTFEANRLAYNTWLRNNWRGIGFSGLLDAARVCDPTDSGKWSFDAGYSGPIATSSAIGGATLSGGGLASVAYRAAGAGYGNVQTVPAVVYPYPGETGSGAVVTATSNSSGQLLTWTVSAPGANYQSECLIAPAGPWTFDGLHPCSRGVQEIIAGLGLRPGMFPVN